MKKLDYLKNVCLLATFAMTSLGVSAQLKIASDVEIAKNLTVKGDLIFGNRDSKTESRNDAGLRGDAGAKSGFFETAAPVNYPTGATSWWHLLETRHSNPGNNFAMQIAGSFFDQELYFRKINNSATTAWNKFIYQNSAGNVGIGITTPAVRLDIVGAGGGSVDLKVNGRIKTGDVNGAGGVWLNTAENAFVGDFGQYMGLWTNSATVGASISVAVEKSTANVFIGKNLTVGGILTTTGLNLTGNVGVGTNAPKAKLDVVGQSIFSRDAMTECCSGGNYTVAIAENTNATGRTASISFHNAGQNEGIIELSKTSPFRAIKFRDTQGVNLGIDVTGSAKIDGDLQVAKNANISQNLTVGGDIIFGNNGTKTQSRDNAGLQGATAKSGFFETAAPVNYPTGAGSWWHLIDTRHSNVGNNFAMQIAGSFFDQELYFRKTANSATTSWNKFIYQNSSGHVDIGTATTAGNGFKLHVNGGIGAEGDIGITGNVWATEIHGGGFWTIAGTKFADYVFEKSYKIKPLTEVEQYINTYGHLPNVPSAKEIEKTGMNIADMTTKAFEKIEELTLYMIEMNKKMESQDKKIEALEKENAQLKKQ